MTKLRDAAARSGYYNERGTWVNAEWMAEAADALAAKDARIINLERQRADQRDRLAAAERIITEMIGRVEDEPRCPFCQAAEDTDRERIDHYGGCPMVPLMLYETKKAYSGGAK